MQYICNSSSLDILVNCICSRFLNCGGSLDYPCEFLISMFSIDLLTIKRNIFGNMLCWCSISSNVVANPWMPVVMYMCVSGYWSMLHLSFIVLLHFANFSDSIVLFCFTFSIVPLYLNHYFFGNACTKSGPLRFSQFSSYWLILFVCWFMSFAYPIRRLLGVR